MRAVAKRLVGGPAATAKIGRLRAFRLVFHRRHTGALVGAVAEWLIFTAPTGAPPIRFTFFYVDFVGRFLRNNRFRHLCPFHPEGGYITYAG